MGVDNQVKTSTVLPEVKPLTVDDLMKQAKEEVKKILKFVSHSS